MSALALIVTRLSGALGAELSGLDLSQPLRPDDLATLRSAASNFSRVVPTPLSATTT